LEKAVLPPGDSTGLEIILSTRTYTGLQTKRPKIYTNIPEPDSVHLVTIRANVITQPDSTFPIVITPYNFDISQFGPILRKDLSFGIENVSDEDLEISIVEYPDSLFTITMPGTVAADSSIDGHIELTPLAYGLEFEESITFELNDMAVSRFTVPITRVIGVVER
jgi:hypothetical protein